MNKLRLGAVLAMLTIVVSVLAGCGTSTVSVADVAYKDMPLQIHNEANVTALNKATITPTVSGAATYTVKVGDKVTQGQVVATIDTSALQQQLMSLQGQLSTAQAYTPSVTTQQRLLPSVLLSLKVHGRCAKLVTLQKKNTIVFLKDLDLKR